MFAPRRNGLAFHRVQEDSGGKRSLAGVFHHTFKNFWCANADDKEDRRVKELSVIDRLRVTPIHEILEVAEGEIIFKSKCHFEIVDKVRGRIILKPEKFEFDCFGGCFEKHFKVWISGLDEDGVETKLYESWIDRDTEITVSEHRNRVTSLAWDNVSNLLITASIAFESSKEFLKYTTFVNDGIRRAKMLKNV